MDFIGNFISNITVRYGLTKNTEISYRNDLMGFQRFLKSIGKNRLVDCERKDFMLFLEKISEDLKTSTVARKIAAIRKFFKFALENSYIKENFIEKNLITIRRENTIPKIIPQDQIDKIIGFLEGQKSFVAVRTLAIIRLLLSSGLRISECLNLKVSELKKGPIMIEGKGRKSRLVIITEKTYESIIDFIKMKKTNNEFIFSATRVKGILGRQIVFNDLKRFATKAGCNPSFFFPHNFRHTLATSILENGGSLLTIQKLLGHEDLTTTEVYTHVLSDKLKESLEEKHPLGKDLNEKNRS